jgi:acetyl-CoA acetyltransferase
MTDRFEHRAAITGIGQSAVGRRLGRTGLDLTVEAGLAAIADAGLDRTDIDGISTYPGAFDEPPGFSPVGVRQLHEALRLDLSWFQSGEESAGQLGSVVNAALAVANGLANHVLCFRTVTEASAQGGGGRNRVMAGGGASGDSASAAASRPARRIGGFQQWTIPFGAPSAANWIALMAQRHMHEHGTTREQLGAIAVSGRAHAARNPAAVFRDPLDLEAYLAARTISTPFCLFDCDVPVDGSTAVVVSRSGRSGPGDRPPVRLEAVGTAFHGRPSWDQRPDLTSMAMHDAARHMWSRTDLTPADVDVAQLYDGFTFLTLSWIEALGFCDRGAGGPFVEGGARLGLDGELPLNTAGGQLSGGRLHGYGLLHEACVQLRGEGGDRQVPGTPRVAVAAAGGGPTAGCLLLTAGD